MVDERSHTPEKAFEVSTETVETKGGKDLLITVRDGREWAKFRFAYTKWSGTVRRVREPIESSGKFGKVKKRELRDAADEAYNELMKAEPNFFNDKK